MYGTDTIDPRYARVDTEIRYNLFRCKYCGRNVRTDTRIAIDNSEREKWERRSERLKGIFK